MKPIESELELMETPRVYRLVLTGGNDAKYFTQFCKESRGFSSSEYYF